MQSRLAVPNQENILRLDISMHNIVIMKAAKGLYNLLDDFRRVFLMEKWLRHNIIKQLAAVKHFLNNKYAPLILECFMHLKDVWVVDLRQNFDLVDDFVQFGLRQHVLVNDFDASLARRRIVVALSYFVVLAGSHEIAQTVVEGHLSRILQLSSVLTILLLAAVRFMRMQARSIRRIYSSLSIMGLVS